MHSALLEYAVTHSSADSQRDETSFRTNQVGINAV